uniref:Uncharacterized protein n=1 Tax=Anguilla anguilla TaxID=7936 RepID=A0A0E9RGZ9_ANGAN
MVIGIISQRRLCLVLLITFYPTIIIASHFYNPSSIMLNQKLLSR